MFNSTFYKNILDKINSNVYITDVETDEIVYMNDFMKQTFHLENPEGQVCWKVLQKGMTERCSFCKVNELKNKEDGETVWKEKNTVNGRVYTNVDTIYNWNGRLYHMQNSVDITDQIQLSLEATIDELTGVRNRSSGKKYLEDLLKGMEEGEKFSIALYDVNGLKWVNDTFGHLEGDRLLRFVAQTIQKELDGSDFVFRLSGDEFIVVFMDKDLSQAEAWMQKIIKSLDERRIKSGFSYDVSFSYGLAGIAGGDKLSVSDVLSIADAQMYIQKRDHHILMGKKRLQRERVEREENHPDQPVSLNRDFLFEAIADSIDDYPFIGKLQTGEFMYSQKMVLDFNLPGQIISNASAFWAERIHPDDEMMFLRSNQEITDGRIDHHTIAYRALDSNGEWVHLLCRGRMIRDKTGKPELFAGVIRNLDRQENMPDWEPNIYDTYDENLERGFYFIENSSNHERLITETRLMQFVNRQLPGGILAVYDEPGFPIFCYNQAILDYTGYTSEEITNEFQNFFGNLLHPDDEKRVKGEIAVQLESRPVYDIRYRLMGKDGKEIWVYERGRYVVLLNGRKLLLSFFIDISHEIALEQKFWKTSL